MFVDLSTYFSSCTCGKIFWRSRKPRQIRKPPANRRARFCVHRKSPLPEEARQGCRALQSCGMRLLAVPGCSIQNGQGSSLRITGQVVRFGWRLPLRKCPERSCPLRTNIEPPLRREGCPRRPFPPATTNPRRIRNRPPSASGMPRATGLRCAIIGSPRLLNTERSRRFPANYGAGCAF